MDFLAVYSEAGMIGVVGAMFIYMVYSMNRRGNETRDRRHEKLVEEVNDLSDILMEVKGNLSRINGKH